MTSTLQQAAYNTLGFSVKKTMQLAQKLYEGIPLDDPKNPVALITYMRTDSLRISDTALTKSAIISNETLIKNICQARRKYMQKQVKQRPRMRTNQFVQLMLMSRPAIAQNILIKIPQSSMS